MNKICTTIEQSKRLIELGIDINMADMYWEYNHNIHAYDDIPRVVVINNWDDDYNKDIPAWSLSALLGLMPITCILSISNGHYRIASNETNTFFHNNPFDATFEMVCWLLENKKL